MAPSSPTGPCGPGLGRVGVRPLFTWPGSPWENGYAEEGFNGKLRDEPPGREIFSTLWEAQVPVEGWRQTHKPSSPGYRPPAPETTMPAPACLAAPAPTRNPQPASRLAS